METIVFLDRGTVPAPMRAPAFAHQWNEFDRTAPEEVLKRLTGVSMAITNKVKLREDVLSRLPLLKLIALTATGFDNIDVPFCQKKGIAVANAPGYAKNSVPEHALMMMLALRRNLPAYREAVNAGRWQSSPYPNLLDYSVQDLRGTTLGLVGYGTLARGVEALARAFGMEILVAERKGSATLRRGRRPFEDVLKQSDVISIHSPLTPETRGMIGRAELALLKPTAILINTARGGLVDEQALADALSAGHLGGAGVDVLSEEPPRGGNPLLERQALNLIVTPHIAWTSRQALEFLAEQVIGNLEAFMKGNPVNLVSA